MSTLDYRLTVRNQADTGDLLTVTTIATGPNPYIVEPPSGDGQSFDIVTGRPTVGAYRVRVADQNRVITQTLTNAQGQQQYPGRKATVSVSEDRGATWTVLVAGYVNELVQARGLVFEFTIGETTRTEQVTRIFTKRTPSFDRMSCLIGGPVRGGFGPIPDYGGWHFHVDGATGDRLSLTYVSGYQVRAIPFLNLALGGYEFVRGSITAYARSRIEAIATPFFSAHPNAQQGDTSGTYFGLEARVEALNGTLLGYWTPLSEAFGGAQLLRENRLFLGAGPTLDPSVVGTDVVVYVYPTAIGPDSPLHVSGHPCDLIWQLWSDAGIAADAASYAATKTAIGPHRGVALRFTDVKGMLLADFQAMLFSVFGFSYRVGTTGTREMFATRIRDSQAPAVVLTSADLRGPGDSPWKTDEGTILTALKINTRSFTLWQPKDSEDHRTRPIDEITVTPNPGEFDNPNTTGLGEKTATFDLPGDIYDLVTGPLWSSKIGTNQEVNVQLFTDAVGAELFDRLGTGLPSGTLPFLPGVDAQVGDLVVLDIDHLPNGSVRGGQRVVQITKRTETPGGPDLTYADAGSTAQASGVTPAFTVAKDTATSAHSYARITLTNAAALGSAGLALRIEWGFGATQPTGGTLLARLSAADLATTTAIRTPRVQAGALVWVRMRTEAAGQVPGPYTTWSSAQLDVITPPTALSATAVPGDSTAIDLAWTAGAADVPVLVRMKLTAATRYQDVARLPAGSTQTRIHADTGTTLDLEVVCREDAPYNGESAAAATTFTTGGTAPTLTAPTDPVPFAGTVLQLAPTLDGKHTRLDGTYGIEVTPTDPLGLVVPEVAVETGVGTGTPGAFVAQSPLAPAPFLGRTRYTAPPAARDGKRRYLRAFTRRAGATDSAPCAVVSVDPWSGTLQRTEDIGIPAPAFSLSSIFTQIDSVPTYAIRITFDPPTSPYYARTRFTITPDDGTGAIVVEAVASPTDVRAAYGASYTVVAQAVTISGVVGDASAPDTVSVGTHPGLPIGIHIYDPGFWQLGTGSAPPVAVVPQGALSDPTGLTLHPDMVDAANRPVSSLTASIGANELENADFETPAKAGSGDLVAGWYVQHNDDAALFTPSVETTPLQIYAGTQAIAVTTNAGVSVPANTTRAITFASRKRYAARPGESRLLRIRYTAQQNVSPPAGLVRSLRIWARVYFSGGGTQDVAVNDATALAIPPNFALLEGPFTVPTAPANQTVTGVEVWMRVAIQNTTASAVNTPATGLMWDVRFDAGELRRLTVLDTEITGNLPAGVTQSDGVAQRVIAKGHVQGQAKDTETVLFDQPFQSPPLLILTGGVAFDSSLSGRYYDDTKAINVTAAQFTVQARFRKKGTLTSQSDPFPLATLTGAGQESDCSLTTAAADNTYTVSYSVQFDSPIGEEDSCTIHIDADSGSGFITRATRNYSKDASLDTQHFDDAVAIGVTGMGAGKQIRIYVASLSAQSLSALTVTPGSVDYQSGGSDVYVTRTPDATDRVTWDAIETSQLT